MITENKTVDFSEQLKAERELFLGKTDKIPGSNLTVKEAKEAQDEINAEFEQARIDRAKRVRQETDNAQAAFRKERGEENTTTALVVPGVLVEMKNIPNVPLEQALAQNVAVAKLPSDEELAKMDTQGLVTLAGNRNVKVNPNVDTQAALIARLKGNWTEARFESLKGKDRATLESYATELGIQDVSKEAFANVDDLSSAIEKVRKSTK